ncbi:hypothetical protein D9V37_15660 [Nocardioides mangrovicus]|uniref:Prenyltransferase n=1 Tax=Nocardioides mangrovicus TaxID=2478913 RepID=A0A3L8NZ09_9ACTN|nr:UbiA family prenyltransferase [Nocardioides mangrovicus]RLV47599.1 hypothetical protein D9V37_15660 [Nocardioides mangrovicus]
MGTEETSTKEPLASARARSEVPEQLAGAVGACHPLQALLMGVAVAAAAYVSGRPLRETLVAGAAILVVQAALGLLNDAADAERDRAAGVAGKPVAEGHLPPGNASFLGVCLMVMAVPLALENGTAAAVALLGYLLAGLLSLTPLRRSWLSWLPWAAGFALLPAYLAYGGWGLGVHGSPPTWTMTVLAAALGVGVHLLLALPHLVADNRNGMRHLPLRIALRTGASRLLVAATIWTGLCAVALVLAAFAVGLRQ